MQTPLISRSKDILGGMPVFHGTRVPIQNLIDYLSTGETIDTFLEDFPTVSRVQVTRFLDTATQLMVMDVDENSS